MKKQILKISHLVLDLIPILMGLVLMGTGCEKEPQEDRQNLFGTWKFVAFGTTDGSTRTAQPNDCDKCYVITFKEDTTMVGKSVINILGKKFILSVDQLSFPWGVLATEVLEEGDPHLFTEALENVNSFKAEKSQLKLFYAGNKFLLFHPKTK